MIKAALLKNYRIPEFIQFITNILMIISQHEPKKLKIEPLVTALNQTHERLQEAFKQHTASEITPQLAKLDTARDRAIVCLRKVCEGYMDHPDERLKAAGQKVVECIDKYGSKLYSLNYGAETAILKNLVRDLQTNPECIIALKEVHMETLVQQMHETNLEFEKRFIQRLGAFSQYETKGTKELTQFTTEAYRTLVQHIDAHAILAPSEAYTSLINHMNENIDHYNLVAERRKATGDVEEVDIVADAQGEEPVM
jgi:hypothetical protein